MAKKKLYSFKFRPDFLEFLRNQAEKREMTLTEYFEKGMAKVSKYKEKDLV